MLVLSNDWPSFLKNISQNFFDILKLGYMQRNFTASKLLSEENQY